MISAIINNKPCLLIAETDRYALYERESSGNSIWTNFVVEIRSATGRKYYTIGWNGERFSKGEAHDTLKNRAPEAEKWATSLISERQRAKNLEGQPLLLSTAPHDVGQPIAPRKGTAMLVAARQLADLIRDYRTDEGVLIDAEHVVRWAAQFPEADRAFIVEETTHVLNTTYLSATRLDQYINQLVQRFSGDISQRRWIDTHLAGNSQSWMVNQLRARHFESNLAAPDLLFVDDIIFSGGRAFQDIKAWTNNHKAMLAPQGNVLVLSIIRHKESASTLTGYQYGLQPHLRPLGFTPLLKQLAVVNNGRYETNQTQCVLRCVDFPEVHENPEYHKHFQARTLGHPENSVFSSDAARTRYEIIMFNCGLQICLRCPQLPKHIAI